MSKKSTASKVSTASMKKDYIFDLDEPAEALSVSPDHSMVVVAGRQIMKVYEILDGSFSEKYNLRTRTMNLNYSASDVAWSPVQDNIIATTSTNGSVVIWNLEKSSNKIEKVFIRHSRAATKVCFHNSDPNIVISGSKDAKINLYDLRENEPIRSFSTSGGSDSVRDVQFGLHPDHQDMFVVADDSGYVRFWEMRRTDRPVKQFPAHQGHVASVDLHPDPNNKNLLATGGGRDKFIRVWDWSKSSPEKPIYAVETSSPVARAYWRPLHTWHIASCSVINDFAINVWDIRRPFIPFASFEEHQDVVSDMAWCASDPTKFISTGKDSKLIQHSFDKAQRPLDFCNEVAVDISPFGEISFAVSTQLRSKKSKGPSRESTAALAGVNPRMMGSSHQRVDPFGGPISSLFYSCAFRDEKALSMDWFLESARRYKLSGMSLAALCDHNAHVAFELDRPQVAQTWMMLKTLFASSATPSAAGPRSDAGDSGLTGDHKSSVDHKSSTVDAPMVGAPTGHRATVSFGGDTPIGGLEPDGAGADTEDESEVIGGESQRTAAANGDIHQGPLSTMADFFFGGGELDTRMVHMDDIDSMTQPSNWQIKSEVFEPRTDDLAMASADAPDGSSPQTSPTSAKNRSDLVIKRLNMLSVAAGSVKGPAWNPLPLVKDSLFWHADLGDVQTSVCILLVLGERGKTLIDQTTQECWFLDYLEMLDQFQLWAVAAMVIKLCWIPSISMISQNGTAQVPCCGACSKPTGNNGWICTRCRKFTTACSVCQQPVRGLWAWCQVCGHGGHVDHITEWFGKYTTCPTGCGHKCQTRVI